MTRPRKALISLADTPYYHITSRCVRRAFLCGVDHYSGKNYEHRRQWVVDRIRLLSSLFAIDVCAYAVMNNHYHLVLKICPEQIEEISDNDVMNRWCALFKGPLLIQRYRDGEDLKSFERTTVSDIVNVWRSKLSSISWFMRCLNQPIAHQANREDNCTGKFWESRFTSQALKSEEALLSCMAYVDLNPVRAGIADTPETSSHTSIRERLQPEFVLQQAVDDQTECGDLLDFKSILKPLLHFENRLVNEPQPGILFDFEEYLALVDWTGRNIRSDKRGHINSALPPILDRLQITFDQWRINTTQFEVIHPRRFNRQAPQLDTG
ncbi:MAG: transposase [Gammaproteobacteria bacterium]|jgi:REP element-mobilizing transposase RayT|nr:transposase [Gammaproteobacteria bacterium]